MSASSISFFFSFSLPLDCFDRFTASAVHDFLPLAAGRNHGGLTAHPRCTGQSGAPALSALTLRCVKLHIAAV
ncbi:hypothetical protein ASPZODRAFT_1810921 [Penicilliopsis zonata CBS 506.65]|uniref:Uncharacterized protein n=1 Tax=Penicilliopsis zonata CBS 506.65 TaxID=1073090 RepID=A0A1L9SL79_9EURO|nr:hypothetical protein ASPZODRAFT_1810921 [Penicilliopsis zonata CBS 506.65]OJJ47930.1 hypothetical protein ASPZODRAFT_1810921 [Penicilliopsis zonata CBS 506.65]